MHDYLFEHQDALDDIHLSNYAKKMDLDIGKFKKEMSGHVYASLIDNSLKSGIDSGVEVHQLSLLMEHDMKTHGT